MEGKLIVGEYTYEPFVWQGEKYIKVSKGERAMLFEEEGFNKIIMESLKTVKDPRTLKTAFETLHS